MTRPHFCQLSERHFGAGSDGMIWNPSPPLRTSKCAFSTPTASEARMCGNGIRCVGKYVYEKEYTGKTHLTIETLSGIRTLDLALNPESAACIGGYGYCRL